MVGMHVRVIRQNVWGHLGEIGTICGYPTDKELKAAGYVLVELDMDQQPGLVQPRLHGWWYDPKSLTRV